MSGGLHQRCEGCAFSSGTKANRDDHTQLVIQLCVEAREAFYCHERVHELQEQGATLEDAIGIATYEGKFSPCSGYTDAVTMLREKGYFTNQPEWKRELARRSIQLMDDYAEGRLTDAEVESGEAVRAMLERLRR